MSENKDLQVGDFIILIWVKRKVITIWFSISIVFGALIAFTTPDEYDSTAIFLPQQNSSSVASSLSGLAAGLTGLKLGDDNLTLSPDVYDSILSSTPFLEGLLDLKVKNPLNNSQITVRDYMVNYSKKPFYKTVITLPTTILIAIKGSKSKVYGIKGDSTIITVDEKERKLMNSLNNDVTVTNDIKTGLVTVTSEMQDPLIAALATKYALSYLETFTLEYQFNTDQKRVIFLVKETEKAKIKMQASQEKVAAFSDYNRNVISSTYNTTLNKLQQDANILSNIYTGLAQQLEQAQVKAEEKDPVIKIIEPVSVPNQKAAPSRILMILIFGIIGFIITILVLYIKNVWRIYKPVIIKSL
jgi:uncharacterized protein involved in exopolysaccharide biosynthesis